VTAAFLHRVYFMGSNTHGDPWRLPANPPAAVRPLLHAEVGRCRLTLSKPH